MGNDSFLPFGLDTPAEDIAALVDLVGLARRPDQQRTTVVEVGSWVGRTARAMADAGALVWCVDTWEGSVGDTVDDTERMVRAAGGSDTVFGVFCKNAGGRLFRTVFPCRGPSALWSRVWPYGVDLVFIDGDHRYEAVKADIESWLPKVRPGGYLCGHDLDVFAGVNDALRDTLGAVQKHGRSVWVHQTPTA